MWILWAGVLLCSSSYSMSVPFLPLFLFDLGVNEEGVNLWAGIVHSAAFLVGAIFAPLWGSLADQYGRKKMVIRAGLSLAVIYTLIAFVGNVWQLLAVRVLHGLAGGFVPASMSVVAGVTPQQKMGWSLGMMQAGTMSGGILGPLFGGLLATWFGQRMSFVIAGVLMFIATAAVIFWVHEGNTASPTKRTHIGQDLKFAFQSKNLLKLLMLLVVFQLSVNMIQPLMTLHIADLSGTFEGAVLSSGFVLSIIGIAGIVASPLWGRVGESRGYRNILVFCLFASGLVAATQFFVGHLWVFTLIQCIYGFFLAGVMPSINTLVVRCTPDEFRGRSFGLTTSANQIGGMLGPLIGGALGSLLSIHWIFVTVGAILLAAGAAVLTRFRTMEQAPAMSGRTGHKNTSMENG